MINVFRVDQEWHVGYWIDRQHWGKGISSRALSQMLEVCSRRPIHAVVSAENLGSKKVLDRCGFVSDGGRESPETSRYMACWVDTYIMD